MQPTFVYQLESAKNGARSLKWQWLKYGPCPQRAYKLTKKLVRVHISKIKPGTNTEIENQNAKGRLRCTNFFQFGRSKHFKIKTNENRVLV